MAALTEEQSILRDQATDWAKERAPVAKFRAMRDADTANRFDDALWREMIELGWTGIIVPEAHGGAGLGHMEFAVVLEQLGRELTASPLFASALVGASAIIAAGETDHAERLLPRIVSGDEIVTLALEEGPRHAPSRILVEATAFDGGYKLSGAKTFVPEGMAATTFIIAARSQQGLSLFVVPATAPGLTRTPMQTFDSRGYAQLKLNEVPLEATALLGAAGAGAAILDNTLDRARVGMSAEMLGTGDAAFDMTLDYLKNREQFGQVIGAFQALGHRASELFSAKELARSCMEAAAQALDDKSPNAARQAALAKAKVGDFLFQMSNQLIQIHGGIGMTDDFDAGLYLKRARAQEALYGGRAFQRDRYASLRGY